MTFGIRASLGEAAGNRKEKGSRVLAAGPSGAAAAVLEALGCGATAGGLVREFTLCSVVYEERSCVVFMGED